MEAIVNIAVYSIVILICMTVALTYLKARISLQKTQQAVEELSLTMNQMAKEIRMSSLVYPNSDGSGRLLIKIKPNDGSSMEVDYYFDVDNSLKVDSIIGSSSLGAQLIMENTKGSFNITNSNGIPLIQIQLHKVDSSGNPISGTYIQTSVSMRSGYNN